MGEVLGLNQRVRCGCEQCKKCHEKAFVVNWCYTNIESSDPTDIAHLSSDLRVTVVLDVD